MAAERLRVGLPAEAAGGEWVAGWKRIACTVEAMTTARRGRGAASRVA